MKLILACCSLLFVACAGSTPQPEKQFTDSVLPAEHVQHVYAKDSLLQLQTLNDNSNTYTLYLPAGYDTTKQWPLLVFCDPHASGSYPVQLYRKLASAYGIILAGSNRSKNGMAPAESAALVSGVIDDLGKRLSLDKKQLFICGFSGGARVAGYTAMQRSDIAAVISCSAGIAAETAPAFICISAAGTRDMNYNEVENQHKRLEQQKARCYFLPFTGKHEWAPNTVIASALACIRLEQTGAGVIAADTVKTKSYITAICDNGVSAGKTDHLIAAPHFMAALKAARTVKDTALPARLYKSITGTAEYKSLLAQETALLQKEQSLQQLYANAIVNEPLVWWPQNLKGIDTVTTTYSQQARRVTDMHFRVWGYLSLMSYSYAGQALKQNNFPAADHFISIYKMVDPQNEEWAYMRAMYEMKQQQPDNALAAMKDAVKLGFTDKMRFMQEPAFQSVWSDKRFMDLFAQ